MSCCVPMQAKPLLHARQLYLVSSTTRQSVRVTDVPQLLGPRSMFTHAPPPRLIGVHSSVFVAMPSPATEPNQELVDLFAEHDLTEAHAKVITAQFGVGSTEDLADYFEPESSPANWRAQMFDDIVQWKQEQWIIPKLRQIWHASCWIQQRTT